MWFRSLIIIVVITVLLGQGGCSTTYNRVETGGVERAGAHLRPGQPILIAIPADGKYGDIAYPGSGQAVAQQLAAAFSRHANHVDIAPASLQTQADLLRTAHDDGAAYLVVPSIGHWEHRATAWSGMPSRTSVGVVILEVAAGNQITSTLLEGKSAIMTFLPTSPDDVMSEMITD